MIKPLPRYLWAVFALCILFFHSAFSKGIVLPVTHNKFKNKSTLHSINSKRFDDAISASGPLTFCDGSSVTLMMTNPPSPTTVFKWFKDGIEIQGATLVTYTASTSGDYSASADSKTYAAVTVTVNPKPVVTITTDNNGVCSGSAIQFNAGVTVGVAPFNYVWDFGDSQTATGPNPSHVYNSIGCNSNSFFAKVTVTDANGCIGTSTKTMTVLNAPDIDFGDANDQFNPFSNCQNNPSLLNPNYTVKVKNNSANASCVSTYTADWGDGTVQTGLTNASFPLTHTYTQLGAFILQITATASNGCHSSKSYTVANQSNPAGSLGTLGSTTGLCAPASVPFTISNWQLNSPGTTYTLDFGDGTSVTLNHPLNATLTTETIYHTYTKTSCPQPTFTATLKVSNACATTPYTAGNIQLQIKPAAEFSASPNPTCLTRSVTFTNNTTPGSYGTACSATTAYSWDFGDPASATNTSTSTSPTHLFSSPGTYTVTLTASNPCGSDIKTHSIIVNPLPTVTNTNVTNICSGNSFSIPLTSDIPSTFTWVATNNSNVSGESLSTQNSSTISNVLVNNSTIPQTVTYTITPFATGGGCAGPQKTLDVTVYPVTPAVSVITPINYCQNSPTSPLNATATNGYTLYWYSTISGGVGSTTAPTPNSSTLGTSTYYVGQTNNTTLCESVRSPIVVNVLSIPTAPTVSSIPINYCQGSSSTVLTATASSGNTLRWYLVETGGTYVTAAPTPSTALPGLTSYYVSQATPSGCESSRSKIDVVVNPTPNSPAVTTPVNYCLNSSATLLVANPDAGNSLRWYTTSTGGTGSTASIIPSTTIVGTKSYYVSQITTNGCESPRIAINVTVNALPSAPAAITTVSYCVGDPSSPLSATVTTGNTLNWYDGSNTPLTIAPTPSTTSPGTTIYYVSQTNSTSSCESPKTQITVNVTAIPAAPGVNTPIPYCQGSAAVPLTANPSPGNTLKWYTVATGGIALSGAPTPNTASAGLTSYYVSQTNSSSCESGRSKIDVVINPTPGLPTVTTPVSYCLNAIASPLTATPDADNSLKWYTVSAGGTGSTTAITPTTSTVGTKTYYVSQVNSSGCESSRASISVTINPLPVAPSISSGPVYCVGDVASPLLATAAPGNTLKWYSDAALTHSFPVAPTPSTTTPGNTTYYVTQNNGTCESAYSSVLVIVNPAIYNYNIGDDQTICTGGVPTQLRPTQTIGGGNGSYAYQWESSIDNGTTWQGVGTGLQTYSPPALSTSTQYRRTVYSGACVITSTVVNITVQGTLTNYGISNNQTICSNQTPSKLIGQLPTGGNGSYTYHWESSPDGNSWTTIANTNSVDYTPGVLTTTTHYRRFTSSGTCSGTSSEVIITVNPLPAVSTVTNQIICNGSTTTTTNFTSNTPGTITYSWTNDNNTIGLATTGSGNISAFIPTNNTHAPNIAHLNVTATLTNGGTSCPGTATPFSITALPLVSTQPINNIIECVGTNIPAKSPTSDAATFTGSSVTYSWNVSNASIGLSNGAGTTIPAFTAMNTTTSNQVSTVIVTPIYHYGGIDCSGTPTSYTITIKPGASIANAGNNDKICNTVYTLSGNTPQVGTGTWSQPPGQTGAFNDANSPTTSVSGLVKGTRYTFKWTISTLDCSSTNASVNIDVLSDIVNSIKTSNAAICPGASTSIVTDQLSGGNVPGTLSAQYSYSWLMSHDNINWVSVANETGETISVNPTTDTYYKRVVSSYGACPVTSTAILIKLNPVPPPATAGNTQVLCNQTSTQLDGSDPGVSFTGTWTDLNSPSALTFSPNNHTRNATVNGLQPGSTYTLKWTVTNGACGFTDASVIINDLQPLTNQITVANPILCYGVPVAINGVIPTGGTGTYQYSWQSSTDGTTWLTISGQNGKDLNTILTQSVKVKRIVGSGTCTLESNIVDITIQPAIDNNSITGSAVTCANQTDGTLHGSLPTGGDGNYVYQWQKSDDGITYTNITSANQIDFITPVLTTSIYYRRIVSTALCTGAQQSTSNVIHVIVNPNSKADFTASALSGCAPFNLQAVITSTPYPDRNATYEWFADGVSIGSGVNFPAYSITTPNQQVLIKLVTTSSLGCDTNSHELKFRTIPTVAASFTKDQTVGCGPLTVHFVNTSVPLNAGTYAWDFGNGQTSTSIQPADVVFQPHPLNRDTTYVITLKATTDCSINTYTDSVKVRPMPKAIFTPDQTTGCSPFTVNITNQSRGIPNTYTYYFGDGQKLVKSDNGAVQYTYTTLKTDTVTLKLVAENECGKDSSSYNIVIYPNTVNANLVVNGDNKFGCVPFTVKFDNNSTGANSFNWTFGDGNTANTHIAPESLTHTFTTPGVYTVKLNATNGCSSATATETITVYPQPVAAFSVSQLQYCAKDSVAFNNQSVADANTSYQWNFGDGSTSNGINPKHPYVNPGKYTVSLTLIKSYPNGSVCTNVISHDVEIIPLPTATFTSNATPLNCAPFTLTVHSTPANASSVEWHFGDVGSDGNEVNGYTASHTFVKPGVYKVKLIAYNLTGCLDSTTQIVRVTETPVAAFIPGDSVLCGSSSTIHFTNKSTYGGSDLVSYKWIVNNSTVSTQKDPTYTFTPPATAVFPYIYTVKLVVSSTIGCSDTVTHKIQINALPKAGFSVSVASSCTPFKAVINNTSQYADQYKWYVDNVLTSTDKVPTNIYFTQPAKTYKLKLVVNNLYGCKTDSIEKVITTYPKPTALFTVTDSTSCNGKLDLKVVNSSVGATSYNWNFGDGSAQSSAMVPTHLYGAPGLYQLRLIADNGFCKDTTTHYIQIAAPPKAGFLADNVAGCTLLTTTFQNASINATSYVWDFGDGTFSTSKNPVHTFGYLHSPYTVKLIVFGDYGCSDTTILTKYISVSAPPKAAFTVLPDTVIKIPDYGFTFKNQSSADVISYRWDFGDHKSSTIENPEHTYLDTGTYKVTLIVTNSDNCTDTLIRKVQVAGVPGYLYVPNAFEPGSGKRELKTFTVRASGLSEYSLKIFNKWGELIWETTKLDPDGVPLEGWDGMMHGVPAPQGVYVWKISAKYIDGTEWKGMKYPTGSSTKVGTLNLMR